MADTRERPINEPINIEQAAKRNPAVDPVKVQDALAAVQNLRKQGVSRTEFDLVSPFSRVRVRAHNKTR